MLTCISASLGSRDIDGISGSETRRGVAASRRLRVTQPTPVAAASPQGLQPLNNRQSLTVLRGWGFTVNDWNGNGIRKICGPCGAHSRRRQLCGRRAVCPVLTARPRLPGAGNAAVMELRPLHQRSGAVPAGHSRRRPNLRAKDAADLRAAELLVDSLASSCCHSGAPPPGPRFGRPEDRLRGEPGTNNCGAVAVTGRCRPCRGI
jgi:hypothetical protein